MTLCCKNLSIDEKWQDFYIKALPSQVKLFHYQNKKRTYLFVHCHPLILKGTLTFTLKFLPIL